MAERPWVGGRRLAAAPLTCYPMFRTDNHEDFGQKHGAIPLSKLRSERGLTRRDKDAWERLERGLNHWQDERIRFITLTGVRDLDKDFRKLKRWLKAERYLAAYFGVYTGEGTGVVHLVFAGRSVRYGQLSKKWADITGSWNVHISAVKDKPGIMQELTRQRYVKRYISSRNWLPANSVQQSLFEDTN